MIHELSPETDNDFDSTPESTTSIHYSSQISPLSSIPWTPTKTRLLDLMLLSLQIYSSFGRKILVFAWILSVSVTMIADDSVLEYILISLRSALSLL